MAGALGRACFRVRNSMIIGVGIDIVEIERVEKACRRGPFLRKIYTEAEQDLIGECFRIAAGNFAVKEAVAKVFGTGFGKKCMPREIEVLRDPFGKPYVCLYGKALETMRELSIDRFHVSISNIKELASAYVVGESCNEICSKRNTNETD